MDACCDTYFMVMEVDTAVDKTITAETQVDSIEIRVETLVIIDANTKTAHTTFYNMPTIVTPKRKRR